MPVATEGAEGVGEVAPERLTAEGRAGPEGYGYGVGGVYEGWWSGVEDGG